MSQTEWYVGNVAGDHHKTIVSEVTGKTIALVYEPDETAEFIVRAVNAHDNLAAALRECLQLVREADDECAKHGNRDAFWDACERINEIATAALAKAGS